jgi:cAMP phosphodiesterase
MRIQVLGGHGGLARGFSATSFLIDHKLLIDAGAVASTLSVEDQAKIDNILISHAHLDHTKDLAFLCDNCFGQKSMPFQVFTHDTVKKIIKTHLLNDIVWPDFTILPSPKNPTMEIHAVNPEELLNIGKYKITPVKVQHPLDAMGFIIDDGEGSVLFTVDTGPTERIWEVAKKITNLKAIFTEVSFPNRMQQVATISDHHTPQSLKAELDKMPAHIPIVLTHLKPHFKFEIMQEIRLLKEHRIRVLEEDGEVFNY